MIEGYHHFRKHPFCCCWKLIFWLVVEPTRSEKIWTSNWIISPSKGENEKNVWNQHLVLLSSQIGTIISYISCSPSDGFWEINKHFPKIVLTKKVAPKSPDLGQTTDFFNRCWRQWKTRVVKSCEETYPTSVSKEGTRWSPGWYSGWIGWYKGYSLNCIIMWNCIICWSPKVGNMLLSRMIQCHSAGQCHSHICRL